jgi:predicted nucleic acid-binding protein
MTHGIDTDFLVASEIVDHPFHGQADALLQELLDDGHDLAVAPQTLAEFMHIVTDARRMPRPLGMSDATTRAEAWWNAAEVVRVFPGGQSVPCFLAWLRQHRLGRKRLLDTLLAATFLEAGISRVLTNNGRDYEVFGCFEIVDYR